MKKLLQCLFLINPIIGWAQDTSNASLASTHWVLIDLNNIEISKNTEGMDSFIEFSDDNTFKGFSGCNRFQGKFSFVDGQMKFDQISTTKMKCANDNHEQDMIKNLEKTINFKITKDKLFLSDKKGVVATFTATKM